MTNMYNELWETAKLTHLGDNYRFVEHGWEQHVLIDLKNNLVYRYPRSENASMKLVDEVELLRSLNKTKWPIQIPNLRTHTATYTVYDYIPGMVLTPQVLESLTDTQILNIGGTLGEFLAVLHSSDPQIIEQKKTKQTMSLLDYYSHRIDSARDSGHYSDAHTDLRQLIELTSAYDEVVVHGDLHGLNIVISEETKELVGVIDFSELELGDRSQDFRKIFMTHERLVDSSIQSYENKTKTKLSKETILLWAYVNEWANVCFFNSQPDNLTYQRAYNHLKKWGKI